MSSGSPNSSATRVAILLPSMQVGGAERVVLEELACMKRDPRFALEVHLVFEKGPFYTNLEDLGIPVHVWNAPHKSPRMLKTYLDIARHLRRTGCQILHSHLLDGVGPLVGRLAGSRVVATVHSDKPYSALERMVLSTADLVLACGTQVHRNICSFIPSQRVGVLQNGIRRPEKWACRREETLSRYGFPPGSRLVLSLGRLVPLKGFDLLVDAFSRVIAEVPDAVLLIGGDGEERERLNSLVAAAGLQQHVRLSGMVSEIHELLSACDLYVNSSRWEGLPMTLLEAMAHAKAMVATSVGGNPEVVRVGDTGMLVPPDSPSMLADAIIQMLKNDGLRQRAGQRALELFVDRYTIDRHCEKLAGYYQQVTQNGQPGLFRGFARGRVA